MSPTALARLLPTLLLSAPLAAAPLTPVWTAPSGDDSRAAAWGDADLDGDLDLLFANCCAQPLRYYRNDAGTLVEAWASIELFDARAAAWADFDQDGDLDFAVGADGANLAYRNDGAGFGVAWSSTEGDSTQALAWGDLDGDGDLDLAAGNGPAEPNRVYRNDAGTFALVWSSAETDDSRAVAWGDLDGDGDLDLATGNDGEPNRIYRNDLGVLVLDQSSLETDRTTAVAWADFDGDGDLDLATGNDGEPARIHRNALGTLTLAWSSSESDPVQALALGDPDADGRIELLTASGAGQPLRLHRPNLDGAVTPALWTSSELDDSGGAAFGDLDGDGALDLAVASCCGTPSRVYRSLPASLNPSETWTDAALEDEVHAVAWGDHDGDGDLDLAAAGIRVSDFVPVPYACFVHLYRNDAGGLVKIWQSSEEGWIEDLAWGDIDGDGDLDLAAAARPWTVGQDARSRVYRNDAGVLSPDWETASAEPARALAFGDYDGDGDLDLVLGGLGMPLRLFRNEGVLTPVWVSPEPYRARALQWGDLDQDGDLDLVVAGHPASQQGAIAVLANDLGTLALSWLDRSAAPASDVALGDSDGDGDLDLAATFTESPPGPELRHYRNESASFAPILEIEEPRGWVPGGSGVSWADWDADGDLDLLSIHDGSQPRIHHNSGGSLAPPEILWSGRLGVGAMAAADVDGDGDLDLAQGAGITGYGTVALARHRRLGRDPRLPETPTRAVLVERPGTTRAAYLHSSAERLASPVAIPYRLVDAESDPAVRIGVQWSPDGGGRWLPATAGPGGDGLTNLTASPWPGTTHVFSWDADADGAGGDNIAFRVSVLTQVPRHCGETTSTGRTAAASPPFRLRAAYTPRSRLGITPRVLSSGPVVPGDTVDLALEVSNGDSADQSGVDIEIPIDDPNLGDPASLRCPAPASGSIDTSGAFPLLRCSGLEVPAGTTVSVPFQARVRWPFVPTPPGPQRVCFHGRIAGLFNGLAPACAEVTASYPPPLLTEVSDGYDDADADGQLDPGEGVWFRIDLCHASPSDQAEAVFDLEDQLDAMTDGTVDRLFASRGTAAIVGAGFRVTGIRLAQDPDPQLSCAIITFRTRVAAGARPDERACNGASVIWTDPGSGLVATVWANGDPPAAPGACHTVGVPCASTLLAPVRALGTVKDGVGGIVFTFPEDSIAREYHINSVGIARDLQAPGPHRPPLPGAVGVAECTAQAPALSCIDADALSDPRPLVFYQAVAACAASGLDEGPID